MDIYTVQIGRKIELSDGSPKFIPWAEFDLFDDLLVLDTWLSGNSVNYPNWPATGEWIRPISNKEVVLTRSDGGPKLARLRYANWPWKKGATGRANLDVPIEGQSYGTYVVTDVS